MSYSFKPQFNNKPSRSNFKNSRILRSCLTIWLGATIIANVSLTTFAADNIYIIGDNIIVCNADRRSQCTQGTGKHSLVVPRPALKSPAQANLSTPTNVLIEYPQVKVISAPKGFIITTAASPTAKIVQTITEATELEAMGYVNVDNQTFYMSEWSWNRYKQGKKPNWFLLRQ